MNFLHPVDKKFPRMKGNKIAKVLVLSLSMLQNLTVQLPSYAVDFFVVVDLSHLLDYDVVHFYHLCCISTEMMSV